MTHFITAACACVKDQACVATCPVDCILGDSEDQMLFIDPALCIDCGACVPVCPAKAIRLDKDATADDAVFMEINKTYFLDKPLARKMLADALAAPASPL